MMQHTIQHNITKRQDRRPDGRKSFIANHMGITLATYYKYRKGIWPKPFDYEQRHEAAIAAWELKQARKAS